MSRPAGFNVAITLTSQQAIQMFERLGATIEKAEHHYKISLDIGGTKILRIVLSRGSKEIPSGSVVSIFRELGLASSMAKCIALRDGVMTRDQYIAYLRSQGVI